MLRPRTVYRSSAGLRLPLLRFLSDADALPNDSQNVDVETNTAVEDDPVLEMLDDVLEEL